MEKIEITGLNETVFKDTCENGLNIYMWPNKKAENFYMTYTINYGAIHTEFKVGKKKYKVPHGIAHFLEHIKFNVGKEEKANDYFAKLGSDVNAETSFDYTTYQVYSNDNFKENLNYLIDFVQTRYFTNKTVEQEKGIITEEVKMDEDSPDTLLYFETNKALLKKSNYRNLVTGTKEDVKSITLEDIERVYDTFYHPENSFIIITGKFNPYEAVAIIKENQRKKEFPSYQKPVKITPKEPKEVTTKEKTINGAVEIPKVRMALKIPAKDFSDFNPLRLNIMLQLILLSNFGVTSDLKEELMENKLIYYLDASMNKMDEYYIITIYMESKYPDEAKKIIRNALENMTLAKETLERKVKASIATLVLNFDDITEVNYTLMYNLLEEKRVVNEMKEILENITFEETKKVLDSIKTTEITEVTLLPFDNN